MLTLKNQYTFSNVQASVFGNDKPGPVLYFNSPLPGSGELLKLINEEIETPFHLILLSGMKWDDALTPWPMGPTVPGDQPCAGNADHYLARLEKEIIPVVEQGLEITERIITGYSLSGLFAIYSLYKCSLFSKAASMSGSLWYPGFVDYVKTHSFVKKPEAVFFSLGKEESKTSNPYFRNVLVNTEAIVEYYHSLSIPLDFVLEPGNHFYEVNERVVRGFQWILTH